MLALGIGVTTAVFTLVRGVLLDPLPVPAPRELRLALAPDGEPFQLSAPALRRLESAPAFAGRVLGHSVPTNAALRLGDAPAQPVSVQFVSGGFFRVLGIPAVQGRMLHAADYETGAPRPVAAVSHAFWRTRLGGDPEAIGRNVRLTGTSLGGSKIGREGCGGKRVIR